MLEPADLGLGGTGNAQDHQRYRDRLEHHLLASSSDYDVVDVDHEFVPHDRRLLSARTLVVARSVLLVQHLETLHIPRPSSVRHALGRVLHGRERAAEQRARIAAADRAMAVADLVNVSNQFDRAELVRRGVPPEKIVVLPFGLSARTRVQSGEVADALGRGPTVAFVGTFDYRKGASDFPSIVDRVVASVPAACFRLLGTAGLFPTERSVRRMFPRRLWSRLDIRPRFEPEDLPDLLAGCSVGVFPSYYEGFGFGVLEMLAAGLPVIAYDAPGPGEMLAPEQLVAPGDVAAMAARVSRLLGDEDALADARDAAYRTAAQFSWDTIARTTAEAYVAQRARRLALAA